MSRPGSDRTDPGTEPIEWLIEQRVRDVNATERTEAVQQAFALEDLRRVPVVGQGQIGELHGVLEHLHETLNGIAQDWSAIHDHAIASDLVPLGAEVSLGWLRGRQNDHVAVRMPALALVGQLKGVDSALPCKALSMEPEERRN